MYVTKEQQHVCGKTQIMSCMSTWNIRRNNKIRFKPVLCVRFGTVRVLNEMNYRGLAGRTPPLDRYTSCQVFLSPAVSLSAFQLSQVFGPRARSRH